MNEHGHTGPLFHILGLEVNSITTTTWGIMLFLTIAAFLLGRNLQLMPTGKRQLAVEWAIDSLLEFLGNLVGSRHHAQKYFPIVGSLFLVILASNYSGVLPGMGTIPGMQAPTSAWSYTLGLGLVVFFSIYAIGFKSFKLGYLKHYFKPVFIMLPMILMEEFVRPLSLSLRLYGNVYGEEVMVHNIFGMVPLIAPIPFMMLGLFFGFMQALVFTLLSTTYLVEAAEG